MYTRRGGRGFTGMLCMTNAFPCFPRATAWANDECKPGYMWDRVASNTCMNAKDNPAAFVLTKESVLLK